MSNMSHEPMLEMFIFETSQLLDQLEEIIINSEKSNTYSTHDINEIFRVMHTIKSSSAMMLYGNISSLAHFMEDLFYCIREESPPSINFSELTDLVLKGADFIKGELAKVKAGQKTDADPGRLIDEIHVFLSRLIEANSLPEGACMPVEDEETLNDEEQKYYIAPDVKVEDSGQREFKAVIYFEEGCQMENIRAFTVLHNIKNDVNVTQHFPPDIVEDNSSEEIIRENGFEIYFNTDCNMDEVHEMLMQTAYLGRLELEELADVQVAKRVKKPEKITLDDDLPPVLEPETLLKPVPQVMEKEQCQETQTKSLSQDIINVSVARLDRLMDLVGEMVIAEAMVVQNPDLKGMELNNFQKAARQLNKITSEIQDMVMSIRMVPLQATFHKMNRIVRDMCKKLGKEAQLEIAGGETEVDKNIIEHIADPLMHLVRNALDHGIETPAERQAKEKPPAGTITLEAKNTGSEVLVMIKDDGRGLNKENIIEKAVQNGLLDKTAAEMTDREIFNLVFLPGFSLKDSVSEFSGRGVGMDVVTKNIEAIGGSISIDSIPDLGTTFTLKIPLTLVIIDGMNIKVGNSRYTIPTTSIKESFRPEENDVIIDPDGIEMIMVRGQCYPVLRLHEIYKVRTGITNFSEGIIIIIEQDDKTLCVFADELLGQQQVVVKALPEYIRYVRNVKGLAGCTLLGDGSISLILDMAGLMSF